MRTQITVRIWRICVMGGERFLLWETLLEVMPAFPNLEQRSTTHTTQGLSCIPMTADFSRPRIYEYT